jgi:hypothetical protein
VKTDGKIGGLASGSKVRAGLLRRDGVKIGDGKIADFEKRLFIF